MTSSEKTDCVLPFYIETTSPSEHCRCFPTCCIYERTTLSTSMFVSPIWCSIPDCGPYQIGDTKIRGEHDVCDCFPFCFTCKSKICFASPIFCQNAETGTTVSCLFCATNDCIISWIGCTCCKDDEIPTRIKCCKERCSYPLYRYRCMISNSGCYRIIKKGNLQILVTPIGCFNITPENSDTQSEAQSESPSVQTMS